MSAEMEEFVRFLIEPVVPDASAVEFRNKRSRRGKNLVLVLSPEDFALLGADDGRIGESVRIAADAWATKNGVRVRLLVREAGSEMDEADQDDDAAQAEA